jgi:hypothetical protein
MSDWSVSWLGQSRRAVAPRFARCGAKKIGKTNTPPDHRVLVFPIYFAPHRAKRGATAR